jgi:hypothetical protein
MSKIQKVRRNHLEVEGLILSLGANQNEYTFIFMGNNGKQNFWKGFKGDKQT